MKRREALKHTALLVGYSISGAALTGVLNGCKADPSLNWQPQFFTPIQAMTIGDIADIILPKTNTPGAKDLLVDRFIDGLMKTYFSEEDQKAFLAGLEAFETDCKKSYGKPFSKCQPAQQTEILIRYDKQSAPVPPTVWGGQIGTFETPPFYRKLKELILLGYFTSEQVGEHILSYDPIPGHFSGCISVSEVGNAWSL